MYVDPHIAPGPGVLLKQLSRQAPTAAAEIKHGLIGGFRKPKFLIDGVPPGLSKSSGSVGPTILRSSKGGKGITPGNSFVSSSSMGRRAFRLVFDRALRGLGADRRGCGL